MIKNIIFQQKAERDYLLNQHYLDRIDPAITDQYLGSNLIKLITGPRRAGKSVLALQMLNGKKFAYLNFDDDLLLKHFDEAKVLQALSEVFPDYDYLMLDEIQNLPDWELWINKLYRRGFNLTVTGSNSRLLSKEMATTLTGRYIQIPVYPFSFSEFVRFQVSADLSPAPAFPDDPSFLPVMFNKYLQLGGFPETVLNPSIAKNYLSSLFDSILLKDILRRYPIRQPQILYDLSNYLLSNYCNLFSLNELTIALDLKSVSTVSKYIHYLEESYLFLILPRFTNKVIRQQKSQKKSFVIDNGFIRSRSFELTPNWGRLLENLVFTELIRRNFQPGLSLFYYRTRTNKEVDFLLREGHTVKMLIQVCYDIANPKTLKRETDALKEASVELSCSDLMIITQDKDDIIENDKTPVKLVSAGKYLLEMEGNPEL